jgi:general secretion pathway protein D
MACALLVACQGPVFAQEEVPDPVTPISEEDGLRLNFRGVPLDTVLDYLSKAAGFVIIRDVDIEGTIDVWSHQLLDKSEAVDLLNAILNSKGYAAVQNGRMLTIVQRDTALQRDLPVRKGSEPTDIPRNDTMVTQVIPVRHADAKQLVENMAPLLPEYANISANESSNSIVLTDTQNNIHRMVQIIQALDTTISEVTTIRVYALEHSDATEVAKIVNDVFAQSGTSSGANRQAEFWSRLRGRGRGGR